jgi:succinoglycan biosynthesis transport protein ExoP
MAARRGVLGPWIELTRRRWRTGAVVFGAVLATGLALLFLTRPVYRSEAALRLGEPPPPGGVSPTSGVLSFFQLGGDAFANDLEILASRSLAERVVEETSLNATLVAPAGWHRDSLLAALGTTRETGEATYEIRRTDDGFRVRRVSPGDSVLGTVAPGERVVLAGVTAAFRAPRDRAPREFAIRTVPFAEAVRRARGALRVERPRREANVVALAFDHTDPGLANAVVEATVSSFIGLRTTLHHRESGQTVDSLRAVAERTAVELRDAEERLVRLQREARLVAPEAQSEALVERQAAALAALQRAQAERSALDEMARRLDAARESPRGWTALLSYPAFLENETLGRLLADLTTLHSKREELAARRTADNRELRVLDRQIAYIDTALRELAAEYGAGLDERIAGLEPRLRETELALAALPGSAAELGRRQRQVRLLSEVTVLTEQRLRQEELREALTYSNVQVIDPPALRDRPVWPRKKLGLLVALLLAGATAALGMVVRDRSDPRVRGVDQLRDVLDRPVVAVTGSGPDGPPTATVIARSPWSGPTGAGSRPAEMGSPGSGRRARSGSSPTRSP